jgi:predicted ATPase
MISSLSIRNFKCFREQSFDFGKLNIFCGANGVGKSSVVQSLLIIREAIQCKEQPVFVGLNHLFEQDLGQLQDVFHANPSNDQIQFNIRTPVGGYGIYAKADSSRAENAFLEFESFTVPEIKCFKSRETGGFTYLSPERDGPRDLQQIQSAPMKHLQIGNKGEYVAEVLLANEREIVRPELRYPQSSKDNRGTDRLQSQLEVWAGEVFPGIELKTVTSPGTNAVGVRVKKRGVESDWLKPTNVGFGISYCLPIILSGLLSHDDGMLIVDGPEAHLHPASQSKIAQFLCHVAQANTQVVIETHSDHILNGIRLGVAKGIISPQDVKLHSLSRGEGHVISESITIAKSGSLSIWPSGFFDQTEKDLAEIVKLRKETR